MPQITHSDMRRGKDVPVSNQAEQKMYVIDDLSGAEQMNINSVDKKLAEFEGTAQIEEQNQVAKPVQTAPMVFNAPQKSDEELKKSLEKLIFMGRHNKIVDIVGHKFEISTLTHKENNEIVRHLMKFGEAADLFTIRILTLSYCLRSIDGQSLDDIELNGSFDNVFQKRMTIIDNMQLALVERLYATYEGLVKEADEMIYKEQEKIKN